MKHAFIFSTKDWMGEGIITLNMVEEELPFLTKWNINTKDGTGRVHSIQEIQITGIAEAMHNELIFFDFTSKSFGVEMENLNIGKVIGTGVYDDKLIAWEFRQNDLNFEGIEAYTLQEDGSYKMHAEYVTSDQFRTHISGKIWLPPSKLLPPREEK